MKNLFIIIFLALGLFCGFVFYKTGNIPLHTWSEQLQRDGFMGTFKKISAGQFVAKAKQIVNDVTEDSFVSPHAAPVQIYKWTDAKGVVHYDNQPVKGAAEISINPNANVVPMEKAADVAPAEQAPGNEANEIIENIEKMRAARERKLGI